MNADFTRFDRPNLQSNIKQNWLKINDEHLKAIFNENDLANVIEVLYKFDKASVKQQVQEWLSNQINIDGHIYQINMKPFN